MKKQVPKDIELNIAKKYLMNARVAMENVILKGKPALQPFKITTIELVNDQIISFIIYLLEGDQNHVTDVEFR